MEILSAATVMTILMGAVGTVMLSVRNTFLTNITLAQLSGYVDATTEQVKQDIWKASDAATGNACPGGGPLLIGTTKWLCLDMTPSTPFNPVTAGDVRYLIQTPPLIAVSGGGSPPPTNVKLLRQVYTGTTWQTVRTIAQYVVASGSTVTVFPATAPAKGKLVRFNLKVQTTGGVDTPLTHRQIANAQYRLQVPK